MDTNPNQSSEKPQEKQSPPLPKWTRLLPWILLIIFFVVAWFLPSILGQGGTQSTETVSYTTFVEQVKANNACAFCRWDHEVDPVHDHRA
jgi:hypothetical protein